MGSFFGVFVVIVVAIAGKALEIMMMVAKPLGKVIPVDSISEVAVAKRKNDDE